MSYKVSIVIELVKRIKLQDPKQSEINPQEILNFAKYRLHL
jgi:hypothetical protein